MIRRDEVEARESTDTRAQQRQGGERHEETRDQMWTRGGFPCQKVINFESLRRFANGAVHLGTRGSPTPPRKDDRRESDVIGRITERVEYAWDVVAVEYLGRIARWK